MAARLPDDLYERMQALAVRAPASASVLYRWVRRRPADATDLLDTNGRLIGLPFPGVELKMVPVAPNMSCACAASTSPPLFRPARSDRPRSTRSFTASATPACSSIPRSGAGIIFAPVWRIQAHHAPSFMSAPAHRCIAAASRGARTRWCRAGRPFVGFCLPNRTPAPDRRQRGASYEEVVGHPRCCLPEARLQAHNKSTEAPAACGSPAPC